MALRALLYQVVGSMLNVVIIVFWILKFKDSVEDQAHVSEENELFCR